MGRHEHYVLLTKFISFNTVGETLSAWTPWFAKLNVKINVTVIKYIVSKWSYRELGLQS